MFRSKLFMFLVVVYVGFWRSDRSGFLWNVR